MTLDGNIGPQGATGATGATGPVADEGYIYLTSQSTDVVNAPTTPPATWGTSMSGGSLDQGGANGEIVVALSAGVYEFNYSINLNDLFSSCEAHLIIGSTILPSSKKDYTPSREPFFMVRVYNLTNTMMVNLNAGDTVSLTTTCIATSADADSTAVQFSAHQVSSTLPPT